ncbi:hypothetical protein ETW24_05880 [Leisingera sp. NJS204]|nr:hypothetical protein [Leisingera sp. NJS204]QAX28929.1 hypothetical protein ETW24_05880 [Leisingera sp. NJS204]
MLILARRGKGRKDSHVMLAPGLLDLLRGNYCKARPAGWLLPGRCDPDAEIQPGLRGGLRLCRDQEKGLAPHVVSKARLRLAGGWHPLDRFSSRFFAAGEGSAASVPAFVPRRAGQAAQGGKSTFFGNLSEQAGLDTFGGHPGPLRKAGWAVSVKPPFGGPEAVPACLSRCTRRAANSQRPNPALQQAQGAGEKG